jgi:hypothetical protein
MSASKTDGEGDVAGLRAAEAFIRPAPVAVHGSITSYVFLLQTCTYKLNLTAPSSTSEHVPTIVFLPEFHFPSGQTQVEVSGGKWTITADEDEANGGTRMQMLRWWHAEGEQTISVKGVVRKPGALVGTEEDEGYLAQCQRQNCGVM